MASSPKTLRPVSAQDIDEAKAWVDLHSEAIPAVVVLVIHFAWKLRQDLDKANAKASHLLRLWREALGLTPKTERGTVDAPKSKAKPSPEEKLAALKERRKKLAREIRRYEDRLGKGRRNKVKTRPSPAPRTSPGLALGLAPAATDGTFARSTETVFTGRLCDELVREPRRLGIDRVSQFANPIGLHSSHDKRRRHEYAVTTKTIELEVETVTDPRTGESVTASTDEIGPPNSQATWVAIANTVVSVVGYAIPINRLATMLKEANPYFTSSRLCSFLDYAASLFLPVYLHLGEALADADWLLGDDTKTRVIEISQKLKNGGELEDVPKEEPRVGRIADLFGRIFPRKDGKGDKASLNVSVVIGKTVASDPRSYTYFFRTHLGSLGDLLSKMLEMRDPKKKELTIVSDLATTNLLAPELYAKFHVTHAGCGAHARRPFFKQKDRDHKLCYWMLSAFLILEQIEDRLDELGRTEALILRYRQRYAKKVWEAILKRAQSVVRGEKTYGYYWPKTSEIGKACAYIVKHYGELTRYLDDARLPSSRVRMWRGGKVVPCSVSTSCSSNRTCAVSASGFRSSSTFSRLPLRPWSSAA